MTRSAYVRKDAQTRLWAAVLVDGTTTYTVQRASLKDCLQAVSFFLEMGGSLGGEQA